MIYLCQTCGYRINQRTGDASIYAPKETFKIDIEPEKVGKHLLYKHKPFCSEECIHLAIQKPYILSREVVPANILERGPNSWKITRKLNKITVNKNSS